MASLKPVLKNDFIKADGKVNIKIRISHDGKTRYIKTPWDIKPRFMNQDGTINNKYPGQSKLNMALYLLLTEYNGILEGIGKDIIYMDINTIVNKLRRHQESGEGFIRYIKERIRTLKSEKRFSYAETYEATIKHLEACTGKKEILFKEINLEFLNRFERYLLGKDKKINTVRIYLNNIRAVFNHAIDNDIIKQELFPFRKFRVKEERTAKRNLDAGEIRKLLSQELSPARQRALDLFMLSFYLLGMNFKDMLFLTPKSVSKGRIIYRRYKTGGEFSVKIQPEAKALLDKYKGERYLLRFMEGKNLKRKTEPYKDIVRDTNFLLKKIAKQAGMDIPLSTYFARHSWATIASSIGISRDIIRYALGHDIKTTTDIYLEYDYSQVDQANERVINKLKS
ncbi:MAG TPA: site-specific integrase [Bacteroidales bacterium]|nr:site-specific integrase [Bacteroidales bacterium]